MYSGNEAVLNANVGIVTAVSRMDQYSAPLKPNIHPKVQNQQQTAPWFRNGNQSVSSSEKAAKSQKQRDTRGPDKQRRKAQASRDMHDEDEAEFSPELSLSYTFIILLEIYFFN